MSLSIPAILFDAQTKRIIDWAVFSAGALSLTIAIGGTVLTHLDILPNDQADALELIETVPNPTVL